MPLDEHRSANLAAWDERVAVHVDSALYDRQSFVDDPDRLTGVVSFDAPRLGDVSGKTLLHLQCHFGMDTLSWARLGAVVTGLDFSPAAIEAAEALSRNSGTPGRFVEAEVYDAVEALERERFDVVYTGIGAIIWLPDMRRWAQIVASLLKPGGTFFLREGHPMLFTLDDKREDRELVVRYPYFDIGAPLRWDEQGSYADADAVFANTVSYEWPHPVSEVIQALIDAGLTITLFAEHQSVDWPFFPWMVQDEDGRYVLPEHRERLPLTYSVKATTPR